MRFKPQTACRQSFHVPVRNLVPPPNRQLRQLNRAGQQEQRHISMMQSKLSMSNVMQMPSGKASNAVESVARTIDPEAGKTLGPALKSLEKEGVLNHRALQDGFSKLYGYTSNENGIRHALLDEGAADVDLDEAVFMFGACASFAAYLVNRHKQLTT